PLFAVLLRSFGIGDEGFTLDNYKQFFQRSSYFKALINSIMVGIVSTSIITSISIPFALYVTRTKSAISKVYRGLSLLPMVAPPFILSLSLIILFGRRGVITEIINDLFGLQFSIYGCWGVVMSQDLTLLLVAFIIIENYSR